ncbi:COX15/CtaA family protein [Bythopirellula polymerisocia]|uniref:Cytochrome oxidase assembly protein n=1 Tax=Bythopirellula polymerisocia TaxID=2528003 RepID=A0A5C6CH94_9BACT|nr:COX15/CtaA family protein [Bythopirellula polymerisocia]TWU23562.1 Cytochrome oxidase assembly protein [Bythopirellula polymerisocia]
MITNRKTRSPLVHLWAWLLACATFPLIWWGGLVTTTGAGMAFRDWLTSDGYLMPFYPWLSSTGDKFIEHGHRLLGMIVGLLAIGLVGITWAKESRYWVRIFSLAILVGVIIQGALGGMRVVFDERTLALIHGCTGPLFFAMCVAMVVITSRWWCDVEPLESSPREWKYLRLAALTTILAYMQLIAGAVVRHSPHLVGQSASAVFQAAVYLHVLLAVAIVVHGVLLIWQANRCKQPIGRCWLLGALIGVQIVLGGSTWIVKYGLPRWASRMFGELTFANTADNAFQAVVVTSHVAVGSLILVTSLALALRVARQLRIGVPETVGSSTSRMGVVL